jgi:hypothetical protein
MSSHHRTLLRAVLGLSVAFVSSLPLSAQLDPRLQSSKTDFMDLYQQSSSAQAKPEIVTIFDFSRSMASLMFHPLYVNNDVSDADDYRFMKFVLNNGSSGAAPNNVWTVTARSSNGCATATWTVTVTASGATWTHQNAPTQGCTTASTASNVNIYAQSVGCTNAYTYLYFKPVSNTTAHTNYMLNSPAAYNQGTQCTGQAYAPYTMTNASESTALPTISITMLSGSGGSTGPWTPGTVLQLTAYLVHDMSEGETSNDKNIQWGGGAGGAVWSEDVVNHRYKSVATYKIPDFVPSCPHTTQLNPIDVSGTGVTGTGGSSGTVPPGGAVTLSTKFLYNDTGMPCSATSLASTGVTWSVSPGSQPGGCTNPNLAFSSIVNSGTVGVANTANWTIPAYCGTNGTGTNPYVTVSLDASPSTNFNYNTLFGWASLGTLSATTKDATGYEALRKPDGTAVTATDAANASTSSGLYGASGGVLDVRNWIRAASHVRFTKGGRTIDIPIPWKIIDPHPATVTNPLGSLTVLDQLVKTTINPDASITTTTYGSGNQIEMDLNYKLNTGNGNVFTADNAGNNLSNSNQTTAWLWTTVYRPAYIAWLFNGKYQGTNTTADYYNASYSATSPYIVFDAATANKVLGQTTANLNWGQGFGPSGTTWGNIQVPELNVDGTYKRTKSDDASNYKIPAVTRAQATKQAAIQTWIKHQSDVYWAFRYLDTTHEAGGGIGTTIDNYSTTTITNPAPADLTVTHTDGADSGWTVLNNTPAQGITSSSGNSVIGMKRIASLFAIGETPLTYALARTLAQYNDPNSVFNSVIGTNVSQCATQFLLLFTDGVDNNGITGQNNGNSTTPYIGTDPNTGNPALRALTGNQTIIADTTQVNRGGNFWNLFTLAGIGAHLSDPTLGLVNHDFLAQLPKPPIPKTDVPSSFLPLSINARNGVPYDNDHRVTTMTVGVSMGGKYTVLGTPKRNLFLAAVAGDPNIKTGDLSIFHPFDGHEQPRPAPPAIPTVDAGNDWIPKPEDPNSYWINANSSWGPVITAGNSVGKRADGAVYFFDATDAGKLSNSMDFAFRLAIGTAGTNSTSSPNLPFVGASLGQQVYLGTFLPPKTGGPVWQGDLRMFGIRDQNGVTSIIDKSGNVTSTLDATTAQWSAADALLNARPWSSRKLYTRWPSSTGAEFPLRKFTYTGADYDDGSGGGLHAYVALSQGANDRIAAVQFAMGGDTNTAIAPTPPTTMRANVMGDIINSAPAAIEYNFADVSGKLTTRLNAVGGNRFRLILVGTNQGWLHAFGEVTKTTTVIGSDSVARSIVTGDVDELWAFMPTDFLANIDYIKTSGVKHRFMVDGTPTIYHLDLPPSSGGYGNGVVDVGERAIAVVGLRKGGRSYYALDIHDPFTPSLKWSLVPDEADVFPTTRNLTSPTVDMTSLLKKWGFSTSTPAFGRVQFNGVLRDAVFLGGGFSVPEVEANFPDATSKPTPLGRSIAALDVYTGEVLAAADLTNASIGGTTVGPIGAGVIPFEFFLNSGMAQRAYFLDYTGGLWSWGSKAVATTAPYVNFRMDTSELSQWQIRKVYQDENNAASGLGGRYTTLPAPFKVGSFPGAGKPGSATPAAVGVAMVSGDRNNPLDYRYGELNAYNVLNVAPVNHRLTVVFDRQDSRAWGLDTASGPDTGIKNALDDKLSNFTSNNVTSNADAPFQYITPGLPNYYLAPSSGGVPLTPKFGYYVNFPSMANGFLPKGINPPTVMAGYLFYSYFTPSSADPCTGGNGHTYSWMINDVFNPLVSDARGVLASASGLKDTWAGVASDYITIGTGTVLQGGTVSVSTPTAGAFTVPEIHATKGNPTQPYPKIRVWRTVH